MGTSSITLHLYDGTGQVFPAGTKVLVTLRDGFQKQIFRDYFNAGQITIKGLPFYDNMGDNYAVIAYVEGYKQAGLAPVKLSAGVPVNVDLMLIPEHPVFNFAELTWDVAKQTLSFLAPMDGQTDDEAKGRFSELLEANGSKSLACMMNLVSAMKAIDFDGRSAADFIRQVRWDYKFPAQDRFFAYCDAALIDAVQAAAAKGKFAAEHGCALVHPGSSMSWKQTEFSEADVQLTFHTGPLDCIPSKAWVTVEADIDYYKDLAAHAIFEVCRNEVTGSLTEPADVYALRWIQHRRRGLPDFDPGYTLRKG